MPERERARFLAPIIVPSTEAATANGQTLALIRPRKVRFSYEKKSSDQITQEREDYATVERQSSLFQPDVKALKPCPYTFRFAYETEDGRRHRHTCDDWETAATFYRWERQLGEERALAEMSKVFNEDYPRKGMVLALGTHSRYPGTWLLVGVIRLDRVSQMALDL